MIRHRHLDLRQDEAGLAGLKTDLVTGGATAKDLHSGEAKTAPDAVSR